MAELPVFQMVTNSYAQALDFRAYRPTNESSKYNKMVSNNIAKLVKKVTSQMSEHFFHAKDPVSVIGFSHIFKLVYGTNRTHEAAPMWVLPYYANAKLANEHELRMCIERKSTLITTILRDNGTGPRKRLRSYPEVVIYFLKKFALDKAID